MILSSRGARATLEILSQMGECLQYGREKCRSKREILSQMGEHFLRTLRGTFARHESMLIGFLGKNNPFSPSTSKFHRLTFVHDPFLFSLQPLGEELCLYSQWRTDRIRHNTFGRALIVRQTMDALPNVLCLIRSRTPLTVVIQCMVMYSVVCVCVCSLGLCARQKSL